MSRDAGSQRSVSGTGAVTSPCRRRRTRQAVLRELALAVAALTEARTGRVGNTPGVAHLADQRPRQPRPGSRQPEPPGLWEQLDVIGQLVVDLESAASAPGRSPVDGVVLADRLGAASEALGRAGQALSRSRRKPGPSAAPGEDER